MRAMLSEFRGTALSDKYRNRQQKSVGAHNPLQPEKWGFIDVAPARVPAPQVDGHPGAYEDDDKREVSRATKEHADSFNQISCPRHLVVLLSVEAFHQVKVFPCRRRQCVGGGYVCAVIQRIAHPCIEASREIGASASAAAAYEAAWLLIAASANSLISSSPRTISLTAKSSAFLSSFRFSAPANAATVPNPVIP